MGTGESIRKAAENAMKDLAGTAPPADDAHAPEPGAADEDIQVHSSISEGANAAEGERGSGTAAPNTARDAAGAGGGAGQAAGSAEPAGSTPDEAGQPSADVPRDVPGPAGLPDPDPDKLRADVSEGDTDPSTGLGRG